MNSEWPDGGQVTLKGGYGVAVLVKHGDTINAVLRCHNGEVVDECSYTGRWPMNYGVAQMTSAAAHGPDAAICTEGADDVCPHVEVS